MKPCNLLLSGLMLSMLMVRADLSQDDEIKAALQSHIILSDAGADLVLTDLLGRIGVSYIEPAGGKRVLALGDSVLKDPEKVVRLKFEPKTLLSKPIEITRLAQGTFLWVFGANWERTDFLNLDLSRIAHAIIGDQDIDWQAFRKREEEIRTENEVPNGTEFFVIQAAMVMRATGSRLRQTKFTSAAEGYGAKINGEYYSKFGEETTRFYVAVYPAFYNPFRGFQQQTKKIGMSFEVPTEVRSPDRSSTISQETMEIAAKVAAASLANHHSGTIIPEMGSAGLPKGFEPVLATRIPKTPNWQDYEESMAAGAPKAAEEGRTEFFEDDDFGSSSTGNSASSQRARIEGGPEEEVFAVLEPLASYKVSQPDSTYVGRLPAGAYAVMRPYEGVEIRRSNDEHFGYLEEGSYGVLYPITPDGIRRIVPLSDLEGVTAGLPNPTQKDSEGQTGRVDF